MPGKQRMLKRSTNRERCSTQVISGEKITSPQGRAGEGRRGLPAPGPHTQGAVGPAQHQPQHWHRWCPAQFQLAEVLDQDTGLCWQLGEE